MFFIGGRKCLVLSPSHEPPPTALVCTLGGKPQIATFALDVLLAQHTPIDRVCAVHLAESDARIERSLDHLAQHLHSDYPQPIYLERVPVREWLPQPDGGIGPGRVG